VAKIYVGTSGWTFEGWRGNFYPKHLPRNQELEYASRKLNSIEINGTFYALQKPKTFKRWYQETPEGFCFSVKAPRYITHIRRLREVDQAVLRFLDSGLLELKEKLGPVLWQFPPTVTLKDNRFEKFLSFLLKTQTNFPIRHAFEFRHFSFFNDDFVNQLRKYNVAIVFAHSGLKSPYTEDLTSDFVYARMHGQDKMFKKGYTQEVLSWWANRVLMWRSGRQADDAKCVSHVKPKPIQRDVYCYFDTEEKFYAPQDAINFAKTLKKSHRDRMSNSE
jgi:uncharacterized protein YecE (DUF72 family)